MNANNSFSSEPTRNEAGAEATMATMMETTKTTDHRMDTAVNPISFLERFTCLRGT